MSKRKNYLQSEKKIFTSLGKIGYIILFAAFFSIIMCILDVILYCCVDNYFTLRFLFKGEMKFSEWWNLMWSTYTFSYFKTGFFMIILVAIGVYRSKVLAKEFSK